MEDGPGVQTPRRQDLLYGRDEGVELRIFLDRLRVPALFYSVALNFRVAFGTGRSGVVLSVPKDRYRKTHSVRIAGTLVKIQCVGEWVSGES